MPLFTLSSPDGLMHHARHQPTLASLVGEHQQYDADDSQDVARSVLLDVHGDEESMDKRPGARMTHASR
jgi:hypothetical protein